jgi:fatty acid amide hydrolase
MREKWNNDGISALITPVYPSCAYTHQEAKYMNQLTDYTLMWNALHYPAGSVPVTEVLRGEDNAKQYQDAYDDVWTRAIQRDIVGSEGMPIGVQVIAPSWQDEVVLAVMKAIEQGVGHKEPTPVRIS